MKSAGLVLPGCRGGFVLSQALFPGLQAASARAEFTPEVRNDSGLCVQQGGGLWSAQRPRACEVSGPRGSGSCVGIRMI